MKNTNEATLSCEMVRDLLPLYVEDLASEETCYALGSHLDTCEDCRKTYVRMQQNLQINPEIPKENKTLRRYLNRVRIWYLVCPLIAMVLLHYGFFTVWHYYEGALVLFCVLGLSSQFFAGYTPRGFDQEQIKYQLEAEKRSTQKWGKYRITPLAWCTPALLTVALIEIPRILQWVITLTQSGFFDVPL